MIQNRLAVPERGLLVVQAPFDFPAVNSKRRGWETRRRAIEGFRSVRVDGDRLMGDAGDLGDSWIPFEIDLASGRVKGRSPGFKPWWRRW